MYKDSVNVPYFAQAGTTKIHIIRSAPASAKARKRINPKAIVGRVFACLIVAAIVDVAVINFLFFPECNRITRDCFLVQHLWGAK